MSRKRTLVRTGEATAILPTDDEKKAVTVIGTRGITDEFDEVCLEQAVQSRLAPGVADIVLNPDAHRGYGAPIGCVLVSPSHIYPGPVGVDIKCSMSLLQLDLPESAVLEKDVRRRLIRAICERTPTGPGKGQRHVPKARRVDAQLGRRVLVEGASPGVLEALGIPVEWASRCEDARHLGHDETVDALAQRLERLLEGKSFLQRFAEKIGQLGSYGGGNHFGECEIVRLTRDARLAKTAEAFGLHDGRVAFLSHCGSRGIGHDLAMAQFRVLQDRFRQRGTPFPGGDRELVHAPLGTSEADDYLDDMALAANFATVNHMLINALVLDAFREILPGTKGELVYFISHNIARKEFVRGRPAWVHRKGATRAFPAGHPALQGTPFARTGHPILLPGNPRDGSVVMVAEKGAEASCFSVNHGAGRTLGRRQAFRTLDQERIDQELRARDVLTNCRFYPMDEAPAAYKDFGEVLRSVTGAGLASEVARLDARFVIKDAAPADD